MAWLLFIDESGIDRRNSPYEVLAGVAVQDSRIWSLITDIHEAEVELFGQRISAADMELKARKLLKAKTFRLAGETGAIDPPERTRLAQACLAEGRRAREAGQPAKVTRLQLVALAQAKIEFVRRVFELCVRHQVRSIASIVDKDAPRPPDGSFLRKDYAYLFERFFYFLEEQPNLEQGFVVFDELEKSRSHVLVGQMTEYFKRTNKGRLRAGRIVPEPLFVHSDLTSLIQVADLVAYVVVWGLRVGKMTRPAREELEPLVDVVLQLRHRATRDLDGGPFFVWSFAVIDDLRPEIEKAMPSRS